MIVRKASEASLRWLAEQTGLSVTGEFKGIEAVDASGHLHGVVGYDKWTKNAVRCHVAFTHFCSMELLKAAFTYPMIDCGRNVLIAEIAAHHRKSRKFAYKLGFRELARISDGWDVDDDLIIYTMRKANCRWIHPED